MTATHNADNRDAINTTQTRFISFGFGASFVSKSGTPFYTSAEKRKLVADEIVWWYKWSSSSVNTIYKTCPPYMPL
jgi:hypothetical protein